MSQPDDTPSVEDRVGPGQEPPAAQQAKDEPVPATHEGASPGGPRDNAGATQESPPPDSRGSTTPAAPPGKPEGEVDTRR